MASFVDAAYIGCYTDSAQARDLDDELVSDDDADDQVTADEDDDDATMTVDACIEQCRANGSPYAGLQGGLTCHCGQSYGRHGLAAADGEALLMCLRRLSCDLYE